MRFLLAASLAASLTTVLTTVLTTTLAPAQAQSFVERHQQSDGSWLDYQASRVAADDRRRAGSELRTTSLLLLATLGDGSTIRSGPYKKQARGAVRWLLRGLDPAGRFVMRTDPQWFTDQALASFAVAEAVRLSPYKSLRTRLLSCSTYLLRYLQRTRVSVTPELLFWSQALTDSLRKSSEPWAADLRSLAPQLAAALAGQATQLRTGPTPSETDRAFALYSSVRHASDLTNPVRIHAAIDATLARCDDLGAIHPMAVAVNTLAVYRVGGPRWRTWSARVANEIVKRRIDEGLAKSSWESPLAAIGPVQTTAWRILTIEIYYRYCRLVLASDA